MRTGFWTSILSLVFWAGLSQITRFWTYRISAVVPGFQGRVNDYGWELETDKKFLGANISAPNFQNLCGRHNNPKTKKQTEPKSR